MAVTEYECVWTSDPSLNYLPSYFNCLAPVLSNKQSGLLSFLSMPSDILPSASIIKTLSRIFYLLLRFSSLWASHFRFLSGENFPKCQWLGILRCVTFLLLKTYSTNFIFSACFSQVQLEMSIIQCQVVLTGPCGLPTKGKNISLHIFYEEIKSSHFSLFPIKIKYFHY